MSKIISVINHKGGVGKTTTTANVAGALLTLGKKVLVVDLDGQANLTMSLGLRFDLDNTIYNAMRSNQPHQYIKTTKV